MTSTALFRFCICCFLQTLSCEQLQSTQYESGELSGLLQLQVEAHGSKLPAENEGRQALVENAKAQPMLEKEAQARLEKVKPVAFVHFPKAGSTFLNILYNHPEICPLAPRGLAMGDHTLVNNPPAKLCADAWSKSFAAIPHSNHHFGISASNWEQNKGHFMAMMRQPEQRVISHWHYFGDRPNFPAVSGNASNVREFAENMQGCAVNMLTQGGKGRCHKGKPTMSLAHEAVRRLQEGFAFVGLTERWKLSVCLFHAMYGAKCNSVEFQDVNRQRTNLTWDTTDLKGFRDPYDGLLYEEAVRIFEKNLKLYGVTEENCPKSCS